MDMINLIRGLIEPMPREYFSLRWLDYINADLNCQLQRKDGNTNQVEIPFSLKMKLLRLTWHQLSTI
jgi:hypothetical protein